MRKINLMITTSENVESLKLWPLWIRKFHPWFQQKYTNDETLNLHQNIPHSHQANLLCDFPRFSLKHLPKIRTRNEINISKILSTFKEYEKVEK